MSANLLPYSSCDLDDTESLSTFIAYTPCITPDPPSPLRQLAYMERSPIPGPEIDPEGWKVFPVVVMQGTVFNNREATVYCSVSVSISSFT